MCRDNARRVGMDERVYLLSSMAAATTLSALSATDADSRVEGEEPGGAFVVDDEAMVDPEAAAEMLRPDDEPVFDVQTHLIEYPPYFKGLDLGGFLRAALGDEARRCTGADSTVCFGIDSWLNDVFLHSATTIAVLSAVSAMPDPADDPMPPQIMELALLRAGELCGEGRVLVQGHAWPNVGELGAALDAMERESNRYHLSAWKTYTHTLGHRPFFLDDHDQPAVRIGEAFLAKVEEIGPHIVCVHKGLSELGTRSYASPVDIGPAARDHPNLSFCVYHSGYENDVVEGPYNPAAPNNGVDRLVKTVEDHGIGRHGNVYAELGSTWKVNMGRPDALAHILGKLLRSLGPDRILWGTDSIWYGDPQDQIDSFRTFQISDQFQERYGYRELTEEIKSKILSRNAARLYGVAVPRQLCDPSEQEDRRRHWSRSNRPPGPRTASQARAVLGAEHPGAFDT